MCVHVPCGNGDGGSGEQAQQACIHIYVHESSSFFSARTQTRAQTPHSHTYHIERGRENEKFIFDASKVLTLIADITHFSFGACHVLYTRLPYLLLGQRRRHLTHRTN